MRSPRPMPFTPIRISRQRGVSLFFALVCLVSIMLAAVALVRSVDTSTMISGNLAFQQSATASADAGTEAAIAWLATKESENATKNVLTDVTHYFNVDDGPNGYWASLDPAKSLTAASGPATTRFLWDNTDSKGLIPAKDSSGNTTRFIIQRMCAESAKPVKDAGCMYSGAIQDKSAQNIPLPQDVCKGAGCPAQGQTPQIRITSRTDGPKNTRSYVQAFVY